MKEAKAKDENDGGNAKMEKGERKFWKIPKKIRKMIQNKESNTMCVHKKRKKQVFEKIYLFIYLVLYLQEIQINPITSDEIRGLGAPSLQNKYS